VILSRGRVAASGTPGEILARTGATVLEDAFVALIGSEEGLN
jgi:sodium transport system ATP-binding protein